jgi:hypothetical protein
MKENPMNISGVNNAMRSQAMQMSGGSTPPGMQKVGQAIADKLAMSVDELKSAKARGVSLVDLAASKGVSNEDLMATISDALKGTARGGAPAIDTNKLAMMLIDGFNKADESNTSTSAAQRRSDKPVASMSSVASWTPVEGTDQERLAWDRLAAAV